MKVFMVPFCFVCFFAVPNIFFEVWWFLQAIQNVPVFPCACETSHLLIWALCGCASVAFCFDTKLICSLLTVRSCYWWVTQMLQQNSTASIMTPPWHGPSSSFFKQSVTSLCWILGEIHADPWQYCSHTGMVHIEPLTVQSKPSAIFATVCMPETHHMCQYPCTSSLSDTIAHISVQWNIRAS